MIENTMKKPMVQNQSEPSLGDQLESLRSAYKADPGNVGNASKLAQLYADKGWLNEALEIYTTVIKNDENNYSLLLEFGNLCYRMQDFDEALRTFKKLSVIKPKRVEGWNNLGIVQLAKHEDDAALESFKKVLELEPDNAGALLNLGNYYEKKTMIEKAIELFLKAVAVRPDFADAWFNLGNAYCTLKKKQMAIDSFEKAIKYQREFPSAEKNLGYVHEQMGNLDIALTHYLKALEISRADAPLYVNIANTYAKLKKFDDARKYYLQSVKLAPKDLAAWMGLRQLSLLRGDIDGYAKSTLAVVQRLNQESIAESLMVLRELGHFDKVDEVLCRADIGDVTGDELDAERLLAYQRTDSYPGKITALAKRFKELAKPSDHILSCLAQYAFDLKNYGAAIRYAESMSKDRISSNKLLWKSLLAMGKTDKAEKLIRSYLDANQDCFDAWYFLAKIKANAAEPDVARQFLVKALETGFSELELIEADPQLKKIFEGMRKH
jgi:tetratricopeptide (TPR) repeat protein